MTTLKFRGKEWPMAFTLEAMDLIEQTADKTIDAVTFKIATREDRRVLLCAISAMMQAAAKDGETVPTAEELRKTATPGWLIDAIKPVVDCIGEGMRMETEEGPGEDDEVDLVLEEIKKKESPAG